MSKLVYGFGINDSPTLISIYKSKEEREKQILILKSWTRMLERSCCPKWKEKYPNYFPAYPNQEWRYLSNFKEWALDNGFEKGLCLDKDILVKGNFEYGPNTCAYVPTWVNNLITTSTNAVRVAPLGVIFKKTPERCRTPLKRPYMPFIKKITGERVYGSGGFSNPMAAHKEWQLGKADWLEQSILKYMLEPSYRQDVANALYERVEALRADAEAGRETFCL